MSSTDPYRTPDADLISRTPDSGIEAEVLSDSVLEDSSRLVPWLRTLSVALFISYGLDLLFHLQSITTGVANPNLIGSLLSTVVFLIVAVLLWKFASQLRVAVTSRSYDDYVRAIQCETRAVRTVGIYFVCVLTILMLALVGGFVFSFAR